MSAPTGTLVGAAGRRRCIGTAALVLVLFAAACSDGSDAATDTTTTTPSRSESPAGSEATTASTPDTTTTTEVDPYAAASSWELLWAATGHERDQPLVIGDAVLAVGEDAITIYTATSGERVATIDAEGTATPIVFDGAPALGVISTRTEPGVGAFQDQVVRTATVYSVSTGDEEWSHEVPDTDTLQFVAGTLIVSGYDAHLTGIDVSSGETVWEVDGWWIDPDDAHGRTTFAAQRNDGDVRHAIFDAADGTMTSEHADASFIELVGDAGESDAYWVGGGMGGATRFVSPEGVGPAAQDIVADTGCTGSNNRGAVADRGLLVYFACDDRSSPNAPNGIDFIAAFDAMSGEQMWRVDNAMMSTFPGDTSVRGDLLVGESDGECAAIDTRDGSQVWVGNGPCSQVGEPFSASRSGASDGDAPVFAVVTPGNGMLRVYKDGAGEPVFFRDGSLTVIG